MQSHIFVKASQLCQSKNNVTNGKLNRILLVKMRTRHKILVEFTLHFYSIHHTIIIIITALYRWPWTICPLLSSFTTYQVQDNMICNGNAHEHNVLIFSIIWPSLIRTSWIIRIIVCLPIDFDVYIIYTLCLIGTKFSRFFCANYPGSTVFCSILHRH